MNSEQRKHLRDRVRSAKYLEGRAANPPKPKAVLAAERLVGAWERKRRKFVGRDDAARNVLAKAAEQAILFDSPAAALAAVKRLEAYAAKRKRK